jgi:hypothetical protein
VIHAYCLSVVPIDFLQAGLLRDTEHLPPRGALRCFLSLPACSLLTFGPLSVIGAFPIIWARAAPGPHNSLD